MKRKFRLLLLDAGVVIEAWRLRFWNHLVSGCEITLTKVIAEESRFFHDDAGVRHEIDLQPDIQDGRIRIVESSPDEMKSLNSRLSPVVAAVVHAGEAEALAWILGRSTEPWLLCSGDGAVYRVLAGLGLTEKGISLEDLLRQLGLARTDLDVQFTSAFQKRYARLGLSDRLDKEEP